MNELVVSEVFGPTIQGEGPLTGRRCGFVRLMACNLHCAWCDTPYTWDASRFDLSAEGTSTPVDAIVDQVDAMDVGWLVISGGEPLLHQNRPGWRDLLVCMEDRGVSVSIETNGTIEPNVVTFGYVDTIVASPKLAHAGDPARKRLKPDVLRVLADAGAHMKFVATGPADLDEVAMIVAQAGVPASNVWVMPEGVMPEAQVAGMQAIAGDVIARGWNLSPRLHVLVWGNERGV